MYKITAVFKQRLKILRKVKEVKISLRGLEYNYGSLSILIDIENLVYILRHWQKTAELG